MNKKEMTIRDIEALNIRYSWQGFKDEKEVTNARGWYPVKLGFAHGWDFMINHIREMLRKDDIDTAIIKKTRDPYYEEIER